MGSEKYLDIIERPEAWRNEVCSCKDCDSYSCFAIRYHAAGCYCSDCKHSTCNFYQNLKSHLHSSKLKDFDRITEPPTIDEPIIKKKIEDDCQEKVIAEELTEPPTIDEPNIEKKIKDVCQETINAKELTEPPTIDEQNIKKKIEDDCQDTIDAEELKKRIQKLIEQILAYKLNQRQKIPKEGQSVANNNCSCISRRYCVGLDELAKKHVRDKLKESKHEFSKGSGEVSETPFVKKHKYGSDKNISNVIEYTQKEINYNFYEPENLNKNESDHKYIQNPTVNRTKVIDTSGQLSAQVMNVPYKEYKKTVTDYTTQNKLKLSDYGDIFQRIIDVYKACACKICDCISSVTPDVMKETCNCKPCECDQCRSTDMKQRLILLNKLTSDIYYSDSKCDKIINMESNPCDCKPCECLECKKVGVNKSKNYIVATVSESSQRVYCQCSPCGCFECAHPYGTRNPQMHEMSTEVHRNLNCNCETCNNDRCEQEGVDTCNCDKHSKVMRKPVQKDTNDYDIRYCTVNPISDTKTCSSYEHKQQNSTNLQAIDNSRLKNSIYSDSNCRQFIKMNKNMTQLEQNPANYVCDCLPCECVKCIKHFSEGHKSFDPNKSYECEICDCINRDTLNTLIGSNLQDSCNCKPCNCLECRRYNLTIIQKDDIINKGYKGATKGTLLKNKESPYIPYGKTSSFFDSLSTTSYLEHFSDEITAKNDNSHRGLTKNNNNAKKEVKSSSEDFQLYCAMTEQIRHFDNLNYKTNRNPNISQDLKSENRCPFPIFKLENSLLVGDLKKNGENVMKRRDESETSSITNTSEVIFGDGLGTKKRESSKSKESSCNSSGHDYSDYLIRFPRSTVETCINDVMNLNMYKTTDLGCSRGTVIKTKYSQEYSDYTQTSKTNSNKTYYKGKSHENRSVSKIDVGHISYLKQCKTWNSESPCECQPCDCDKCLYKVAKFKRCRCECASCSCCGTCLSEDQSIFIRKNETTQTSKIQNCKNSCDSDHPIAIEADPLVHYYSPRHSQEIKILKTKENTLFEKSNVTLGEIYKKAINPHTTCEKEPISACLNTKHRVQLQDLQVNYSSVQKTLLDAKAFSVDLLQTLEKYERANNEFDRVSKKFEILHEAPLNNNEIENFVHNNPTFGDHEYLKKVNNNFTTDKYKKQSFDKEQNVLREQVENKDNITLPSKCFKSDIECRNSYREATDLIEMDYNPVSTTNILKEKNNNNLNDINNKTTATISKRQMDIPLQKHTLEKTVTRPKTVNHVSDTKMKLTDLKDQYRMYSKLINRAILKCKRDVWKTSSKSSLNDLQSNQIETPVEDCKSNGSELRIERKYKDNVKQESRDHHDFNMVFINNQHTENSTNANLQEDITLRSTANKDSILNSSSQGRYQLINKNLNVIQNLSDDTRTMTKDNVEKEDNLKEIRKGIPKRCFQEHFLNDKAPTNASLDENGKVTRKFDSMPSMAIRRMSLLLQNTKTTNNSSILNVKSSCDPMKISFQGVRRVSDHTIVVKWKTPLVTTDVLGYELLVDGRAVQKILSPNRNMAVITCLPHSDKIFLTVKTILSKMTASGHYPSTTFVYRPKVKQSRTQIITET